MPREVELGTSVAWELPGPTSIRDVSTSKLFVYDRVFDNTISTNEVFEELGEKVIWNSMEGYNGCIFCYGQTGSGKTFTMHGNRKTNPGIVPLSTNSVFGYIQQSCNREFLLRCSYIELYNECVNDLLNPNNINLSIQEDKNKGVKIVGLTEEVCTSINQVHSILYMGEANKQIASTNFNQRSSRSHSIFRIIVESKSKEDPTDLTLATLNLIDLAGSESASAHNAEAVKSRSREMMYINRSLLTLGTVIMRLSDKHNSAPIPFRDSKLTRLLRPALQGNSKVVIICNISPSASSYDESLSTLKFAQRAKKVKQVLSKNEVLDSKVLIMRYEAEINRLKNQLAATESKLEKESNEEYLKAEIEKLTGEVLNMKDEKESLDAKLEALLQEKLQIQSQLEKYSSLILVGGEAVPASEELDTEEFFEKDSTTQQRASRRISVWRSNTLVPDHSAEKTFQRKESILNKYKSPNTPRKSSFAEVEKKVPEVEEEYNKRETLLIDKIEEIQELLDQEEPLLEEKFEEPSVTDLVSIIEEQDLLLNQFKNQISEKDEQISILKDELWLCRNNMVKMQQQLKELRIQK